MKKLVTTIMRTGWMTGDFKESLAVKAKENWNVIYRDPIVLLDHFKITLPGGFTGQAHRGCEKMTYVVSGELMTEDFNGRKGHLKAGDVEWMTAGKGIVHCQMPTSFEVPTVGFHIWFNLETSKKLVDPRYQELKSKEIPVFRRESEGVEVKVLAGEFENVKGLIQTMSPINVLDVRISNKDKQVNFDFGIPNDYSRLMFVYDGKINYKSEESQSVCQAHEILRIQKDKERHTLTSNESKFLLITGLPLKGSMEQRGGFVMDLEEQVQQAIQDYREYKNGFEKAKGWRANIRSLQDDPKQSSPKP